MVLAQGSPINKLAMAIFISIFASFSFNLFVINSTPLVRFPQLHNPEVNSTANLNLV